MSSPPWLLLLACLALPGCDQGADSASRSALRNAADGDQQRIQAQVAKTLQVADGRSGDVVRVALAAIARRLGETEIVAQVDSATLGEEGVAFVKAWVSLEGLDEDLWEAWESAATRPTVHRRTAGVLPTTWIDADRYAKWMRESDGFMDPLPRSFSEAFPGAKGVMHPSVVAFSEDGTRAFVSVTRTAKSPTFCGNCAGPDQMPWAVVAVRDGDGWVVAEAKWWDL